LLALGPRGGSFVLRETSERELNRGWRGGQRCYAHAIERIDPKAGAEAIEATLRLVRGETVRGRMTNEKGEPVEKAILVSRLRISPLSMWWRGDVVIEGADGRFEVPGLAKGQTYPVHFLDAKHRLGATAMLTADGKEPTVVLRPCGEARARLVDKEGRPVAGSSLRGTPYSFQMVVTPGVFRFDSLATRLGGLAADADFVANVDRTNYRPRPKSDERGRITFPALVPGATYRLVHFNKRPYIRKEFTARSGETVELGEIVVEKEKGAEEAAGGRAGR